MPIALLGWNVAGRVRRLPEQAQRIIDAAPDVICLWRGGYRLDHLVLSPGVTVSDLTYLHQWRRDGLSDHSPLLARIA